MLYIEREIWVSRVATLDAVLNIHKKTFKRYGVCAIHSAVPTQTPLHSHLAVRRYVLFVHFIYF
jgi:hypothetical protein